MAGHLIDRLLHRGREGLADFGSKLRLRTERGHAGGERDLFLSQHLAGAEVFPDDLQREVDLQLTRVVDRPWMFVCSDAPKG